MIKRETGALFHRGLFKFNWTETDRQTDSQGTETELSLYSVAVQESPSGN